MRGVSDIAHLARQWSVQHSSDCAQYINRAEDQSSPTGQDSHQSKCLPGAEENRHFASEIGESRQAACRERAHDQRSANERQSAEQAAKLIHLQRAGLLVNIATETE